MTTKHTPGPWNYSKGYHWGFNVSAGNFTRVVRPDERGPIGKEEDARLIAAAPDLLAALIEMNAEMRGLGLVSPIAAMISSKADAAIAKATGTA